MQTVTANAVTQTVGSRRTSSLAKALAPQADDGRTFDVALGEEIRTSRQRATERAEQATPPARKEAGARSASGNPPARAQAAPQAPRPIREPDAPPEARPPEPTEPTDASDTPDATDTRNAAATDGADTPAADAVADPAPTPDTGTPVQGKQAAAPADARPIPDGAEPSPVADCDQPEQADAELRPSTASDAASDEGPERKSTATDGKNESSPRAAEIKAPHPSVGGAVAVDAGDMTAPKVAPEAARARDAAPVEKPVPERPAPPVERTPAPETMPPEPAVKSDAPKKAPAPTTAPADSAEESPIRTKQSESVKTASPANPEPSLRREAAPAVQTPTERPAAEKAAAAPSIAPEKDKSPETPAAPKTRPEISVPTEAAARPPAVQPSAAPAAHRKETPDATVVVRAPAEGNKPTVAGEADSADANLLAARAQGLIEGLSHEMAARTPVARLAGPAAGAIASSAAHSDPARGADVASLGLARDATFVGAAARIEAALASPSLNETSFVQNVLRQARLLTRPDGSREIRLNLEPAELGAVTVRLRLKDDRLRAVVQVERGDVQQAMEGLVPRIRQALAGEGMNLDQFDISLRRSFDPNAGQQGASDRSTNGGGASAGRFSLDDSAPVRAGAPRRAAAPVGVIDFVA